MTDKKKEPGKKPVYQKPKITSESLTAIAALCNGTATGGRKATTGAPNFCNSGKLKS